MISEESTACNVPRNVAVVFPSGVADSVSQMRRTKAKRCSTGESPRWVGLASDVGKTDVPVDSSLTTRCRTAIGSAQRAARICDIGCDIGCGRG